MTILPRRVGIPLPVPASRSLGSGRPARGARSSPDRDCGAGATRATAQAPRSEQARHRSAGLRAPLCARRAPAVRAPGRRVLPGGCGRGRLEVGPMGSAREGGRAGARAGRSAGGGRARAGRRGGHCGRGGGENWPARGAGRRAAEAVVPAGRDAGPG